MAIHLGHLYLLEWTLKRVYDFWRICLLHLKTQICWHKVAHYISLSFDICILCGDEKSPIPNIPIICNLLFSRSVYIAVWLTILTFSKNQFLFPLIFSIVVLFSMLWIPVLIFPILFLQLTLGCIFILSREVS